MPNYSPIESALTGKYANPKAWCVYSPHIPTTSSQSDINAKSLIEAYNLQLTTDYPSIPTQTVTDPTWTNALKFSFLTPMTDNKYKVFLQYGNLNTAIAPMYAHVINSEQYPKTKDSFWVRTGFTIRTNVVVPSISGVNVTPNTPGNIRLWSNSTVRLSVVVI
jgi:hypothetical protein